ncbi:unnamed protein product [Laminaria digitata]
MSGNIRTARLLIRTAKPTLQIRTERYNEKYCKTCRIPVSVRQYKEGRSGITVNKQTALTFPGRAVCSIGVLTMNGGMFGVSMIWIPSGQRGKCHSRVLRMDGGMYGISKVNARMVWGFKYEWKGDFWGFDPKRRDCFSCRDER